MFIVFWPTLCIAALISVLLLERHKPAPIIWRHLAQAVASLSYLLFFTLQIGEPSLIAALLLVGAAFAVLGDQLLVRRGAQGLFMLGILAFVFMHLFYAAAISSFLLAPADLVWSSTAALLFIVAVLTSIWRYFEGSFQFLTAAYLVALSLNMIFCLSVAIEHDQIALLFGIILFAFSDLLVAGERFIERKPQYRYLSLPAYLCGQFLILYAVAELIGTSQ